MWLCAVNRNSGYTLKSYLNDTIRSLSPLPIHALASSCVGHVELTFGTFSFRFYDHIIATIGGQLR